ncbi:DNA-processing protein DprA [Edwardsiella piscicida]|uniref:DNA-processing protein DprA n=1 Tax=Edwardsiella piscicida TaxID=1263550 RepID=UPI0009BC1739|nr:DNA-processing protein DprA [Edwardsiella piscicida]ARD18607.1 DNA protecting protein DprA [Edwardsiella piscicida]WLJ46359.1 DNA-processing protein DprA [Edwardsiella piscicida]
MESHEIWLRLAQVRGLGAPRIVNAARILVQQGVSAQGMVSGGLTSAQQRQFHGAAGIAEALAWLDGGRGAMLTLVDSAYPDRLRQIAGAPALLFVCGDPRLLSTAALAIVGSRTPSGYGDSQAQFFSRVLAASGLTIVSGLALGIDGLAHRGALSAQGKTIAVLGSGPDCVAPRTHRGLAQAILEADGALVSEFFPGTEARPAYFPQRNRIISGLSLGVLVVEATLRSGSLITARLALDQGREVFAIPGSLDSPQSAGCHWLIQLGASLIAAPADILEQLNSSLHWLAPLTEGNISAGEDDAQLPFAEVLANVGDEVTTVDAVAERIGRSVPDVAVALLELELAGWIKVVSGGYVRVKRAGHVRCTHVSV